MPDVNAIIKALLLGTALLASCALAQETVTFDPSSRQQSLRHLELGSEVHMYHPVHNPDVRSLIIDLKTHDYTMCLKPDIEQTNDNADPYVTDFSKINPKQGGKSGREMSAYFPFLRECKRLTDSLRGLNPALPPFTIQMHGGFYDRYIPAFIETTIGSTSVVDSTKYAEFAENIYAQIKTYKDSTGIDVDCIDPITTYDVATAGNLCGLLDTLGRFLSVKGLHPALAFGHGLNTSNTTNQTLMLSRIHAVFTNASVAQYVKRVDVSYSINGGGSNSFLKAVADSSRKYGFDVHIEYTDGFYTGNLPWSWVLNTSDALDTALNTARARSVYFDAVMNSEVAFTPMLWYDYQANTPGFGLDDPNTKLYRTPAYYYTRHLFGHTNAASSYVLPTTCTNTGVQRIAIYDTATGKVAVMLTNRTAADMSVTLNSGSFNPGHYEAYRLSASEVNLRLPVVNAGSTIVLPANSTTFLTNDYIAPDAMPPAPPILSQKVVTPYSCDMTWVNVFNFESLMFDVYDGATRIAASLTHWKYSAVGLQPQTSHTFTIKTRDGDGNYSGSSNAVTITTPAVTRVIKEMWDDIPNSNMLTSQIPVTTPPQRYAEIDSINSVNTESMAGERIRGFIVPPATGKYKFYLASCAYGDLFLSTDTSAANKTRIAYFGTWNTCPSAYGWNDFAGQISDSISLVAGKYYYFEILHKVWWQGAILQAAWTGPGISAITILKAPYIKPYQTGGGTTGVSARPVVETQAASLSLTHGNMLPRMPVIRVCIPSGAGEVSLTLNNLQGRIIRRLVRGAVPAGTHDYAISSLNDAVGPGFYLVRLRAGNVDRTMAITLSR